MSRNEEIDRLARELGSVCKRRGFTVATAESCTGGGIAGAITDVAGSSAWFERGFVTYSNAAKQEMLGVAEDLIEAHGAVSEAVVQAMAEGALRHSPAELSVAVSGVAGPDGGTAAKPVGTVWLAWARRGHPARPAREHFSGARAEVRQQAVIAALEGLITLAEKS